MKRAIIKKARIKLSATIHLPVLTWKDKATADLTISNHKTVETPPRDLNDDDAEWERIEYTETEEGRAPSSVSGGHFHLKVGTKRWKKTLCSVDWSKRTYEHHHDTESVEEEANTADHSEKQ